MTAFDRSVYGNEGRGRGVVVVLHPVVLELLGRLDDVPAVLPRIDDAIGDPVDLLLQAGRHVQGYSKNKLIAAREEIKARTFKYGFGRAGAWM